MTTRREWLAARDEAAHESREALAAFDKSVREQTEAGRARGGLPCCGTTDIYHRPWCTEGPVQPEPGDPQGGERKTVADEGSAEFRMLEKIKRDPIGANLASLNEIVAELVDAVADPDFAEMTRGILKMHSHALGYEFQGEADPSAVVLRPKSFL